MPQLGESARQLGRLAHVGRAAGHERRPGARQGRRRSTSSTSGTTTSIGRGPAIRPPSQSVLDSAEYQALPHHSEYLAYADQAVFNPQTTWAAGYDAVIQEEVVAALLGTKTPEQALQDMQSRLTDAANFQ